MLNIQDKHTEARFTHCINQIIVKQYSFRLCFENIKNTSVLSVLAIRILKHNIDKEIQSDKLKYLNTKTECDG